MSCDPSSFCYKLPKIELHAHLNGSLSLKAINELIQQEDDDNSESKKKQISPRLESILPTITTRNEAHGFDQFFTHYFPLTQSLTNSSKTLKLATRFILEEFKSENVVYLELRSTPRPIPTKSHYIQSIIDELIHGETELFFPKLLISIDRRKGPEEAKENIELCKKFAEKYPNYIAGLDFSGDARIGDARDYLHLLKDFRNSNSNLKISFHTAEVSNLIEIEEILKFKPDRIGHGTCIYPRNGGTNELIELSNDIPIEICLTSNIVCGSVDSYKNHHIKDAYRLGIPMSICTDDKGAFNINSSEEHSIAQNILELSNTELYNLSFNSISYIFSNGLKDKLKLYFDSWKNQHSMLF